MTALGTMFSFLYVYFDYLICLIFGGKFSTSDFSGENYDLAFNLINSYFSNRFDYGANIYLEFSGNPIFQIGLGIFVMGAIIGLVKRLVR